MKKMLIQIKDIILKHKATIIKAIMILLIFARFWFMNSTNWNVNFDTYYDSRLQVGNAIKMINGRWLGEYDKFILCKNLSYPIFLATINQLHISYPIGFCAFICFTCILFTRSLKPIIKNDNLRKFIFIILLYNPVGLSYQAANHYRNALLPWAVLIVMACILAIYLRRNESLKKILPWALTGMFFTGFYWNLREDSIWFLPFILAGFVATITHFAIEKKKLKPCIVFGIIALLPMLGILLWNNIISAINYKHYGIYATNDRTQTYSAKVLGLLISIDDGTSMDEDVWVSSKVIELAKEASPTFAKLNVNVFQAWPQYGDYSIWALRDSAYDVGYYIDAKSTNELFKTIYEELNEAFEKGKLKKKNGIQLSNTSGIYTPKEFWETAPIAFENFINHINYKEYKIKTLEPIKNVNNEGEFTLYENVLGIRLRRTEQQLDEIHADLTTKIQNDNVIKSLYHNMFFSNIIINCYNTLSPIFFIVAILGLITIGIDIFKNKKYDLHRIEIFILLIGLLLMCYLNSYLVCLWASSFYFDIPVTDNLYMAYTTAETLMIFCFEIIGTVFFVNNLTGFIKQVHKKMGNKRKKENIMTDLDVLYQDDYYKYQEFFEKNMGFNLEGGKILFISAISGSPYEQIRGGGFCLKEIIGDSNRILREEIYVSIKDKCERVVVNFNNSGIKKYKDRYEVTIDEVLEKCSRILGNAEEIIRLLRLKGNNEKADEIETKYKYFLENRYRVPEIKQTVIEQDKLEMKSLKQIEDIYEEDIEEDNYFIDNIDEE